MTNANIFLTSGSDNPERLVEPHRPWLGQDPGGPADRDRVRAGQRRRRGTGADPKLEALVWRRGVYLAAHRVLHAEQRARCLLQLEPLRGKNVRSRAI